jgi:hypothetical protein
VPDPRKSIHVGMEMTAEEFAAEILEAIGSGRDLHLFDRFIGGTGATMVHGLRTCEISTG